MKTYQYFSKWRNEWADFKSPPTQGQLKQMESYKYQIREVIK